MPYATPIFSLLLNLVDNNHFLDIIICLYRIYVMTKEEYLKQVQANLIQREPTPDEIRREDIYNKKLVALIQAVQNVDGKKEIELTRGLNPYKVQAMYEDALKGFYAFRHPGKGSKEIMESISMPVGINVMDNPVKYGIPNPHNNFLFNDKYPENPEKGMSQVYSIDPSLDFQSGGPPVSRGQAGQAMEHPKYIETAPVEDPDDPTMATYGVYDKLHNTLKAQNTDRSTVAHETSHAIDSSTGFDSSEQSKDPLKQFRKKKTGLKNALDYFEGHTREGDNVARTILYNKLHGLPTYQNEGHIALGNIIEPKSNAANLFRDILDIKKHAIDVDMLNRYK